MNASILRRAGLVMMIAVGLSVQGRAQSSAPTKLQGTIHDNASALGAIWVISGEWSLEMKGKSGKADFFASLTMKQDGQVPGAPHTHHISLKDGTVTELANGYSVSGIAAIAGNGSLANTYTGSQVTFDVTGGSDVALSNVRLTFHGDQAVGHFGTDPLNGFVVYRP
jgi:hypothetical protein